jgi:hypothetical protein
MGIASKVFSDVEGQHPPAYLTVVTVDGTVYGGSPLGAGDYGIKLSVLEIGHESTDEDEWEQYTPNVTVYVADAAIRSVKVETTA